MKIGIDVGGSHIGIGIVDNNGKIILKKEKDYEEHREDMSEIVIRTIIELMNETINESKIEHNEIKSAGIAIPGTVSDKIIIKAENLGIRNLNLEEELRKIYNFPIKLENDAKCAAIAEKEFGSLKNYEDAMFLIIGTGVGGAVFLKNKLLRPKRYSGFEVGHTVIKETSERCGCGRKGCFEVYSSMKRFKIKLMEEFNLPDIDGRKIKEFIIKNRGNEKLESMIDTYIEDLSIGFINLINIFEPEAISIGGSFAHYKEIFLDRLEKRIIEKDELYNSETIPKLLTAELKNDAGIVGAAMI